MQICVRESFRESFRGSKFSSTKASMKAIYQGTPRYRFLMTVRSLTVLKYTVLFKRETDYHFLTVPILAVLYGTANYDGFF